MHSAGNRCHNTRRFFQVYRARWSISVQQGLFMSFLISDAYAQTAQQAQQQPDIFTGLVMPMLFLAVVFYFLIIRPQSKRAKEHKTLLEELRKGDEVVTNGGLIGKVVKLGENFIELEISDGINVRVQKQAVSGLMPKGTLKSSD